LTLGSLRLAAAAAASQPERANEIGHDLLPWLCTRSLLPVQRAGKIAYADVRLFSITHLSGQYNSAFIYQRARVDPDKAEKVNGSLLIIVSIL
jgi:hypothetical protein